MKLCFAGAENLKHFGVLKESGVKNTLISAYSYGYNRDITPLLNDFLLVDSGGYTARTKGVKISVKDYIDFINRNNVKLAFNLDTANVAETLRNQNELLINTNANIIPVYHYSDFICKENRKLLDKFIAKFDYIGIGGLAGANLKLEKIPDFFHYIFSRTKNEIKTHGLGITNKAILKKYPFYSVDSTSWLSAVRYANYNNVNDERLAKYYSKTKHYTEVLKIEIPGFLALEKFITELWEKRGVKWE